MDRVTAGGGNRGGGGKEALTTIKAHSRHLLIKGCMRLGLLPLTDRALLLGANAVDARGDVRGVCDSDVEGRLGGTTNRGELGTRVAGNPAGAV